MDYDNETLTKEDYKDFVKATFNSTLNTPETQACIKGLTQLSKTKHSVVKGWNFYLETIANNLIGSLWLAVNELVGSHWEFNKEDKEKLGPNNVQ